MEAQQELGYIEYLSTINGEGTYNDYLTYCKVHNLLDDERFD